MILFEDVKSLTKRVEELNSKVVYGYIVCIVQTVQTLFAWVLGPVFRHESNYVLNIA